MLKRAILYYGYTDESDKSRTEVILSRFAKANGYDPSSVYCDRIGSNAPQYKEMLRRVANDKSGKWTVILPGGYLYPSVHRRYYAHEQKLLIALAGGLVRFAPERGDVSERKLAAALEDVFNQVRLFPDISL